MVAALAATFFYGCNPAKNNAATRRYQAVLTRYNIQYNGDKHYVETLEDMEKGYQDDYNEMVFVHPAEARGLENGVPQPQGDFTRSIEKAEKAIQLHSIKKAPRGRPKTAEEREWKTRSEYNPYLHNSWMLMAKALYMNGDFQKAATIFLYISRHFRWLPKTVTEAKVWEARCYCALGWLYEAEDVLDGIKESDLSSKDLKRQYWIARSSLWVRRFDYQQAAGALVKAIDLSSGNQKTRLKYLLGQVYARGGQKADAYKVFSSIASSFITDYRTRINARIAMSEVTPTADIPKELKRLNSLARYESNAEYLDMIYFAIGNLYLTQSDTTEAIKAYEKAIAESKNQGVGLAQSELALGRVYYERGEYAEAQPHYSVAAAQLPPTFPQLDSIKLRSDILDRYATYYNNVHLQDSLLELAAMTPEERMKVCEKLAADYREEQRKLRAMEEREEIMAQNPDNNLQSGAQQPNVMTMGDQDAAWYFYNEATVKAGRTQFQRMWGNRRLEDNWRRRDRSAVAFEVPEDTAADEEAAEGEEQPDDMTDEEREAAKEAADKAADPANAEYYLKDIPLTDEQKQQANEIIMEGLYNMGVILKNEIRDNRRAIETFKRLLERFPDNIYRLDVYEDLYLIYSFMGMPGKAEEYRQLVLTEFPDSQLGKAMRHPDYIDRLKRQRELQDSLYVDAYNAYISNDNKRVHQAVDIIREDYSTSDLMPKFLFLDALAYATDGDREKFKDGIQQLLALYPETDLTPVASGMLSNLNAGRRLGENTSNLRGVFWDVKIGDNAQSTETAPTDSVTFELNDAAPQLYIFLFPTSTVSANQLLYDIGRHNFETFMARDFDIQMMNSGNTGLLIVSGLNNLAEARRYEAMLAADRNLHLPEEVKGLIIGEKDFQTLVTRGMSIGEYLRQLENRRYEDAQTTVLDPDTYEIESLY